MQSRQPLSQEVRGSIAGTPGYGDGESPPVGDPRTVVAVMGSAHDKGIVRVWERMEGQSECLQRLKELLGNN